VFYQFLYELKKHGLPASLHEYLNLMDALDNQVIDFNPDEFYALTKSIFVKAENQLDTFDKVFAAWFEKGMRVPPENIFSAIPKDWLNSDELKKLTPEQRAMIEKYGDFDELMERLRELMNEQQERHEGGNKWIGTQGTSPFGNNGYNPQGHRVGGDSAGNRTAVKVWQERKYRNLRDNIEINTRNLKVALKYLRHFSREGLPVELNLPETIKRTGQNAGMLDIAMQASKKNKVKVLMLMDVGGSMDDHIAFCERLFSAARTEFKYLEFYYFHNCVYEHVWPDNNLRWNKRIPTLELTHKYSKDYKLIYVGDAAMAPYELYYSGGGIDHNNEVPGIQWMKLLNDYFDNHIWLNPIPEQSWTFYETVGIIRKFLGEKMFPSTIEGLVKGMQCLKNKKRIYKHSMWEF